MRGRFEAEIRKAQDAICAAVEDMDGGKFHEDAWTRPGGGGGISRVLQVRKLFFTLEPGHVQIRDSMPATGSDSHRQELHITATARMTMTLPLCLFELCRGGPKQGA